VSENAKMTSGTIQKELANCCAEAVTKTIKEEMSDYLFSVLVDESCDISIKEQIAIVVRFINKKNTRQHKQKATAHIRITHTH
jgi:NTP pyrophosphatase (non-canonical NTP hydrolase)